jgi:manganese/zinc/iron transport system ATP- binding protein
MDEPFAGIDARTQSDLLALLRTMRDDGTSVIVVHHDMAQVRAAFDWTLLLNVRALGCGPTAEVLTPQAVRAAYGVPGTEIDGGIDALDVWSG